MNTIQICPCGSTKNYDECCGPFIDGTSIPQTTEELMRSRYTAFTQANVEYIQQTMLSPARDQFNLDEARDWAKNVTWQNLEVKHSSVEKDVGYVEFIARFVFQQQKNQIHELSEFKKQDGRWFYTRGITPAVKTFVNEQKIGRNDPCACGSGKKYKKCCLTVNAP